jgi:hypothetical protein
VPKLIVFPLLLALKGTLEKLQFILLYWSERLRTPPERREGMRLEKEQFLEMFLSK